MIHDRAPLLFRLGFCCIAAGGLCFGLAHAQEAEPAEEADPFAVEDPFLLEEPETPEEFLRAAIQAQELVRPELARQYLQQFWNQNPSDEELLRLRTEIGPAAFQRLANQEELQPLSVEIAERATELFRERGATPEHLTQLMDGLSGPGGTAAASRRALINTGPRAVPSILERLRAEQNDSVRRQLIDAMVGMGEEVLPAMHATLDSPDGALKIVAMTVIGRIGSRDSLPYLYPLAYGPNQETRLQGMARDTLAAIAERTPVPRDEIQPFDVSERLRRAAISTLEAGELVATARSAEPVSLWIWDAQLNQLREASVPGNQAPLYQATRFARDSFLVAPERESAQAFYLALRMEWEAAQAGTFEPPGGPGTSVATLLASGSALSQATLRETVAADLHRATVGTLGVLSRIGSPNLLFGGQSELREALNANHPRVQLAAAVTVMRLHPDRDFPDAGRVVEIFARALAETGMGTALIIDPHYQRGATLASFAREMGYESRYALTGQEGFRMATEQFEPSFILVNLNVDRWGLAQTLANFRADTRTQGTPIVVVGPAMGEWEVPDRGYDTVAYHQGPTSRDPRNSVERILVNVPGTGYITAAATSATFYSQLAPILAAQVPTPMTQADRQLSREIAAFWLAQIADRGLTHRYPLEDAEAALIGVIADPKLKSNALIALSAIPSTKSQRAIAQALLTGGTEADQELAADILKDHIRRYGVLLDQDAIDQIQIEMGKQHPPAVQAHYRGLMGLLDGRSATIPARVTGLPPVTLPSPQAN